MKAVIKIVFTIGFCLAMFFAFGANPNLVNSVITQKSESIFSDNTVHADDFLQPQSTHHFVANSKLQSHQLVKFFTTQIDFLLQRKASITVLTFYFQDIDRCEKVSLFLFPYHFFW